MSEGFDYNGASSYYPEKSGGSRHIVQPKLTISQPNDSYEQEADAMADKVMHRGSHNTKPVTGLIGSSLQRKCATCGEEEKIKKPLMRKAAGGGYNASPSLVSNINSTNGGGMPLAVGTRNFMENAFSADFSKVRIHNNANAANMSSDINAKAFTHGSDIYFNQGEYDPNSASGKHLLAHELTHVVQQGNGLKEQVQKKDISPVKEQFDNTDILLTEEGFSLLPWYVQIYKDAVMLALGYGGRGNATDLISVTSSSQNELLLQPQIMFQLMKPNTPEKKNAFNAVGRAFRKLTKATQMVDRYAADPKKKKQLEKAQKNVENALKEFEKAKQGIRNVLIKYLKKHNSKKNSAEEIEKEVNKGDYGPSMTTRTRYSITVDGEKVTLYDHVEAYATVFEMGFEVKANSDKGKKEVAEVINKAGLSKPRINILSTISGFEGSFSTAQSWDRAVLTWGFVQWTGGKESDLTNALAIIKKTDSNAFNKRFKRYGIDVDEKGTQLIISEKTEAGVKITKGDAAAKLIGTSAKLIAVMSSAGIDPQIQLGEIQAANELEIDRPLNRMISFSLSSKTDPKTKLAHKVKPIQLSARLGDIITSEYGVGIMANHTVHSGFNSSMVKEIAKRFKAFVKEKELGIEDMTDRKKLWPFEQKLYPMFRDKDRDTAFKDKCSVEFDSFK